MRGVSLTHPVPFCLFCFCFLSGEFLLPIPCWVYFSVGVSLTHPNLLDVSVGSFSYTSHAVLLFFLVCLFVCFSLGSFSYTSRAGFIFIRGVSLTHPVMELFLSGEFLLHIP